jgi:hypothetical protein
MKQIKSGTHRVCRYSPSGNVNANDPNVLAQQIRKKTWLVGRPPRPLCPGNTASRLGGGEVRSTAETGNPGEGKPRVKSISHSHLCSIERSRSAHARLSPFALRSPELFRDPDCGEFTARA